VKVEDSVPNYVQVECSESAAKRAYQDALKVVYLQPWIFITLLIIIMS